ncbi:MAG: aspartyl/asparaginyl beta-hydroxylase domain-containing protein, partial [Cyanobacteria bacterium P01_F01_bin.42]
SDPVFAPEQFAWIETLEANWEIIRQELDQVLTHAEGLPNFQDLSPDQSNLTHDNLWKTYFFYGFGFKAHKNCDRCPETTKLIEQVPGMTTAFFSILMPHKRIPEHRGVYRGVLRYHLALKVPQDKEACGIRIDKQICTWTEGKSLVFDDRYYHEAWNDSDEIRVVLFMDILRPIRFPFSWLNRFTLRMIGLTPYIQDGKVNQTKWDQRLAKLFNEAANN